LVNNPSDAITAAETLLEAVSAGQDCHYEVWATAAVAPLAAMLYAASPPRNNQGISWVMQAVFNTDASAPSWRSAIAELADQPRLGNSLHQVLGWDIRQRDSIVIAMRDALMPWMPTQRRVGGE
jgi:type IV secretion system protein VirD4